MQMKLTDMSCNRISRRKLLRATAATVLGGVAIATHSKQEASEPPKFLGAIDAHSHVWSHDTNKYLFGKWVEKDKVDPAFTPADLLEIARASGVERVVLIQHAPYHGYDNSYILDCAREHPGVFSVVAMIDERQPELRQRLKKLRDAGARGIRIGPTNHADRTPNDDPPNWLKAAGIQTLWKQAAEMNIAVCPLLGSEFLPTLDPMCAQHPETTCVIDHFGHIDMQGKASVKSLTRLARHPNVYVKVSAFYKFGDQKAPYDDLLPMMRTVVDAFGPQRLMWGSDCPYQLRNDNNYADALALIRDGCDFLSDGDKQAILRDTAARVFFV